MRKNSLILALAGAAFLAAPVRAQTIPDPSAERQLYIRNKAGEIVERLAPKYDHYDVFDTNHLFVATGYAKMLGHRLIFYDFQGNIVATARAELLPPDSDLKDITVVRDRRGHPIGVLARY